MFIATLVATDGFRQGDISRANDKLAAIGCNPGNIEWIEPEIAVDLRFLNDPQSARTALSALANGVDVIVQPRDARAKKVLIADMDSTMITVECIDELADYAGIKDQIAEVTERAMQGELDFAEALHARVALLKGLPDAVIDQCLEERVRIMPGARALVRTMRARGARTLLVSGGFTRFADPVAKDIGFERAVANVLDIANGMLSGTVQSPIVDAARKRNELVNCIDRFSVDPELTLAVGDGANDIPMIEAAGLGVAYHAKAKARAAADAEIVYGDLSALLYAQGIPKSEWVVE